MKPLPPDHLKLFIPGPTEVAPEILAEMARPAIGHRTEECARLWAAARAGLGRLLYTRSEVLLLTGAASAMMEAAVRNCVAARSLHLVCGAFSKRWFEIGRLCGRDAEALEVPLGHGFTAELLEETLSKAERAGRPFEAVTVAHNETATGVANPIAALGAVLRRHPGVLFLVDVVSSVGGLPVKVDEWGIDVCLFGVQKALALPAGLAVAAVSPRALAKAETVPHRGWFLDFLRLRDSNRKEQSPSTPSTAHLYALVKQLDRIAAEGMETRWRRHHAMGERVRDWAQSRGYALFPQPGFYSDTVSCIARGGGPDFVPVLAALKKQGLLVSNGYGELKDKTFRIGHFGEHTLADVDDLLERFDAVLASASGARA